MNCPFCDFNSHALIEINDLWRCVCSRCGASGPPAFGKEMAEEMWKQQAFRVCRYPEDEVGSSSVAFTAEANGEWSVTHGRVTVGHLAKLEDGFLHFFPVENGGCWPSWIMRQIADRLDLLNKPWSDDIDQYFNCQQAEQAKTPAQPE